MRAGRQIAAAPNVVRQCLLMATSGHAATRNPLLLCPEDRTFKPRCLSDRGPEAIFCWKFSESIRAPGRFAGLFLRRTTRQATATGAAPRGYNHERLGRLRRLQNLQADMAHVVSIGPYEAEVLRPWLFVKRRTRLGQFGRLKASLAGHCHDIVWDHTHQ